MRSILISIILLFSFHAFGQQISNVDFDAVKAGMSSYDNLLVRFNEGDTLLTSEDYHRIYYGSCFLDNYNPYALEENEEVFFSYFKEDKYQDALSIGLDILDSLPLNNRIRLYVGECLSRLNMKEDAEYYFYTFAQIMRVIYTSGEGNNANSPFVVLNIADEYNLMFALNLDPQEQVFDVERKLDILKDVSDDGKEDTLYFNVEIPYNFQKEAFE